jgi:hypothetical protein
MYAISQDNDQNQKTLVRLNIVTGNYEKVGDPMPGSSVFSAAYSAFDSETHTYIYFAPGGILYSINANDGKIKSKPVLTLATGENIMHIAFDNSTGSLYGLLRVQNSQKYFLVKINQVTGVCTKIGPGTDAGSGNGSSTIDEANHQFIYYYNTNGFHIATMDMQSGNVLHDHPVNPLDYNGTPGGALDSKDNVFSIKYDNKHGKLYSIHWDANITDNSSDYLDECANIFPNPTRESATIEFSNPKEKSMTFTLHDSRGRLIQIITDITTDYLDIQRNNAAEGVYFYRIYNPWGVVTQGKLVFE